LFKEPREGNGGARMFKPASRLNLYETVLEQLLLAVKEGKWRPGEKIPGELALAKDFQVSRNCIREALKALTLFRILESKPGQGTFISGDALRQIANNELVRHIREKASLIELAEVRIVLESNIIEMVVERATDEDLKELKKVVEEEARLGPGLTEETLRARAKFHETMAALSGNSIMLRLLNSIKSELDAQRNRYLSMPEERWQIMMNEHEKILEFIMKRDAGKAKEALYDHLVKGMETVLSS
jgi:GntR family transcriptional repressor for pyruvate dehydrogenase complex